MTFISDPYHELVKAARAYARAVAAGHPDVGALKLVLLGASEPFAATEWATGRPAKAPRAAAD